MDPTIVVALINGAALIAGAYVLNRVRQDVRKVEIATNSLTEQLVATTKSESYAKGAKDERDRQK